MPFVSVLVGIVMDLMFGWLFFSLFFGRQSGCGWVEKSSRKCTMELLKWYIRPWNDASQKTHVTLPKINIAPENRPGPKRKCHLPTIHFQGCVSFREGICIMGLKNSSLFMKNLLDWRCPHTFHGHTFLEIGRMDTPKWHSHFGYQFVTVDFRGGMVLN